MDKQHGKQDGKGSKYENTCTFSNGEYHETMDSGEYQDLCDLNQRSLYD